MIKVKVTHPYGNWPLARQTPNNLGVWGECQFFINDKIQECDYWFVLDDLPKEEEIICNRNNIILMTLECPAMRPDINLSFIRQFNTIFTYSREIKHPRIIDFISPAPWHIGVDNTNSNTASKEYKIYDDFKFQSALKKTNLISVVSSNKEYTEGHIKRLEFVVKLKEHFGKKIDVFGRGINDFPDKWDAIAPYKYHISLENSSCKDGISEKLYDSFLGETFPFYYGCPNVNDYFPRQSLISIDINDVENSLKIIDLSISNQLYEKSIPYIQESKKLVLDKYNIFNQMANYCTNDLYSSKNIKRNSLINIKPESFFAISRLSNIKKILKKFI